MTSSMPEGGPVCLRRARDQGQPEGAVGGGRETERRPPDKGFRTIRDVCTDPGDSILDGPLMV